ncbi:hypothetical protein MKZ38_009577 [Zalerion maritima]|uniref:Glutathione S-transferase n=1 Tax=Zalerion maritima TaxID=339359 RepID=A0AAD5RUE3_9PEZI|nr:hypothetical protein MKZ38_009577 [Zalerion maritima]
MASEQAQGEPTGLKATKGIELLTYGTPNGYKASIMLEELKAAYPGFDYTWQSIDISKNTQKEPWFTELCPNGRIPVIIDHDRTGVDGKKVTVWEGIAILGYLGRRYDPDHKFSFEVGSDEYDEAEVWMGWQHGGVGPMQGQAGHFTLLSPQKIPYAAQRYVGETERLYGILDKRLSSGRDFVAGSGRGRFSVADMALLGWADAAKIASVDVPGMFPNVQAWLERCFERGGVKKGLEVPRKSPFSLDPEGEEFRMLAEKIPFVKALPERMTKSREFVKNAKEEFGYVYASP